MSSRQRQARGDYAEAAELLWSVKRDSGRLDLVLALQRYLIRSIAQCEKRVPRLRKARARCKRYLSRNRVSKEKARAVKDLIIAIDERIKFLHHRIFLWRCLGDGIPFIYQSKYSLKHLFYDSDYRPKQGPGFISGKTGFRKEYKLLRKGIDMSVPVVLSDITNVIRHGDLCALAGQEPLIVEMKSSENSNARMERQISGMQEIAQFLKDDCAHSFRGMRYVRRVEITPSQIEHSASMNECMRDALAGGCAVRHPEVGLTYVAFNDQFAEDLSRVDALIGRVAGHGTVIYVLSPDESWLPAYPFTLSFEPSNLVPSIHRSIHVAVIIDALVIKRSLAEQRLTAWALMDGTWSFQIAVKEGEPGQSVFRVSEQSFGRVACEFQSLEWWISAQVSLWKESAHALADLYDAPYEEFPKDWLEATCCFATKGSA
ncbi:MULTISPECIES: hypothetical protein [Stenotrophomonas]|uniref:hypothetical protein n=1 Tax=Stenotrophomonas TaxID=40323 RepID=UPI000A619F6F|nr:MULTISPECIES: hypothetical protein [Stenotrophomonas]